MKVQTDIFLPCHLVKDILQAYEDQDRYFLTLSSGWRPIRMMKVETNIFLPCHLVEDLLD